MEERISIVGTLNMELILGPARETPRWGSQVFLSNFLLSPAGSAARVAFPLAKLGIKSYIIGVVGEDIYGREIMKEVKNYGLDTIGIEVKKESKTGICVSLAREDGERFFLSYLGSLSLFNEESVQRHREIIRKTDYFLLTGCFTLPGIGIKETRNIFQQVRKEGKMTLLDPGWNTQGWSREIRREFFSLLKYVDVFLPNKEEAQELTGLDTTEKAARKILSTGCGEVIIKQGKKGSLGMNREGVIKQKGFRVKVIDTTAAGETFNAGILYGLIKGWKMGKRMYFANAISSLVISQKNKSYPCLEGVQKKIQEEEEGEEGDA